MDIVRFKRDNVDIEVSTNMGEEIAITTSFPDVDDTTYCSRVTHLTISDLERILVIAKEAHARHNRIVGKFNLADLRQKAQLSKAKLAKAAKIDVDTVTRAETGLRIQDTKAAAILAVINKALNTSYQLVDIQDVKIV